MTLNMTQMWICVWRIMWTQRTALIETAMWIWTGMLTMMKRKMKRRKMKRRKKGRRWRRRMRMRRRITMTMMAKNHGRLAMERW
jgi:hypothetical protein